VAHCCSVNRVVDRMPRGSSPPDLTGDLFHDDRTHAAPVGGEKRFCERCSPPHWCDGTTKNYFL